MSMPDEHGVVSWFSLMNSNVPECNEFYTQLLGWSISEHEVPGMGTAEVYAANGKDFGGPVELDLAYGVPNHWISYFAVNDVDASCKEARELGGKICYEPFDMPGFGRSAVVEDRDGNVFHLWTPLRPDAPIGVMSDATGRPCWIELMVSDLDDAKEFYGPLLGWEFTAHEGVDMPYFMFTAAGEMLGGIMQKPPEMDMLPPAWLPYFSVSSLSTEMERAQALGGKSLFGPVEVPQTGHIALMQDPTGTVFYLIELQNPA